jgi:hypothetical protein
MAMNVGFKLGTQAKLDTLTSYEAGSFYLTNDSNRLYFAQSDSNLVDLNQYVRTVTDVNSLPTTQSVPSLRAGDFYYALKENVFCIRNNANTAWTQINPDTYLMEADDAVKVVTSETDNNQAIVTTTVKDSADNIVTGNFVIAGGNDISVTTNDNTITIDSTAHDTTYSLKSAAGETVNGVSSAKIQLDATDVEDADSAVVIKGGVNSLLTVTGSANDITLSVADMYNTEVSNAFDGEGAFTTTVTDSNGSVTSEAITPTIKYGDTKVSATFKDGIAKLDVYTISETDNKIESEIEKKLRAADAMHFAGTVGQSGTKETLPDITTVENGTTYKVITEMTSPVNAKIGDMVIAFGDENAETGKLIAGSSWLVIPAGDDQVIVGNATENKVTIKDRAADEQIAAISIKSTEGNPVTVIGAVSDVNGDNNHTEFTVEHAEATEITETGTTSNVTQSAFAEAEFTAITKMVVNKYGHVTEVGTAKLKVVDTHNSVTGNTLTASGGSTIENPIGGTVTITSTVTTADEGDVEGEMTMTSSSLHITGSDSAVAIDLIWGSF